MTMRVSFTCPQEAPVDGLEYALCNGCILCVVTGKVLVIGEGRQACTRGHRQTSLEITQ